MAEHNQLRKFSFRELAELDGNRVELAADQAIERCARDCMDRPGDNRPRKVILEMQMIPVLDDDGDCESVKAQVQIKEAVPTRRSKVYSFGARQNGILTYHPDSLENHAQTTLEFPEES